MCRFCDNRTHAPAELGGGLAAKTRPVFFRCARRHGQWRTPNPDQGGAVLSMDASVGNYSVGDVLIEGSKILSVGASIDAGDAQVIDAAGMIVMPGFIDTHHHQFETALRSLLSDAILINDGRPESTANYYEWMLQKFSMCIVPRMSTSPSCSAAYRRSTPA